MKIAHIDWYWRSGGAAAPPPFEWFESFASSQQPIDDPLEIETGQQLDVVGQSSDLSITDNYLRKAGSSSATNNKLRSVESIYAGAGRVVGFKIIPNSVSQKIGLETTAAGTDSYMFQLSSGKFLTIERFSSHDIDYSYVNDNVYYLFVLLKAANGAFYILLDNGSYYLMMSTTFRDYTEHKMYFDFGICTLALVDWARVNTIETLASDWPFDTDSLTSPAGGTSFTHDANGWIHIKLGTRNTSGTMEVRFRIQDANNYFALKFNTTNQMQLSIYEAGVETVLAAYAAMGTTTSNDEPRIFLNGSNIRVFNNETSALKANITNANYTSETDGEITSLGNGVIQFVHTMPFDITSKIAALV